MIDVQQDYQADADTVWQRIRNFGDLASWLPGVSHCEVQGDGIGAVRTVFVMDGSQVQERLESHDEAGKQFSYSIINAPGFDARANFVATVSVQATGQGSRVRWQASFDGSHFPADKVDKAQQRAQQMYRMCLQHLAGIVDRP